MEKALGAPLGKAFGMTCAGPAAIGTVLADIAVKAANVEVVGYSSPSNGTSFSNEIILTFTGDSGAVRQAVKAAISAGKKMLLQVMNLNLLQLHIFNIKNIIKNWFY